jgi:hypothetical protein
MNTQDISKAIQQIENNIDILQSYCDDSWAEIEAKELQLKNTRPMRQRARIKQELIALKAVHAARFNQLETEKRELHRLSRIHHNRSLNS